MKTKPLVVKWPPVFVNGKRKARVLGMVLVVFSLSLSTLAQSTGISDTMYPEDPWIFGQPVPPMSEYEPSIECPDCPRGLRIGDCWQCFEARGRMCIDKDGKGLFNYMQTTKPGVGFCCAPDSTADVCTSGKVLGEGPSQIEMLCSPESYLSPENLQASPYNQVVTGDRNHQMFAYCPNINQKICGVTDGTVIGGIELRAEPDRVGRVDTSDLVYLKQGFDFVHNVGIGSEEAEYDACYYLINMMYDDPILLSNWIPTKIQVKITKKSPKLNVYAWEGPSRTQATRSLVEGNRQVEVGDTFGVDIESGVLVVAYPEDDEDHEIPKEFGMEYWVVATKRE